MQAFWERVGMLGPVYRLAGNGLSDHDIGIALKQPDERVQSCIAWLIRFLNLSSRSELVLYSGPAFLDKGVGWA